MSTEAPKRWDRKRRQQRDRKLAWKAFWVFVALFLLVVLVRWLQFGPLGRDV